MKAEHQRCFRIVVLEKTLESPLDSKKIKPVNPKGNQLWLFIGRTDAEAEIPVLSPAGAKSWLIGKDPDAGKDWEQEEEGTTEEKMVGWHHQLNGLEFEQTPGDSEGQRSLVCCSPSGCEESQRGLGGILPRDWGSWNILFLLLLPAPSKSPVAPWKELVYMSGGPAFTAVTQRMHLWITGL